MFAIPFVHGALFTALNSAIELGRDIVTKLNATIGALLATPEMKDAWTAKAVEFVPNTPDQFAAFVKAEAAKYAKAIKESGARVD